MNRRLFVASFPAASAQTAVPSSPLPDAVQEMVGVAHRDARRVRELLDLQPGLANAAVDWGFGDWESALDAASHVGQREIAELLVSRGARATIFSSAMLGHLDAVKAFVAAQPGVQRTYGPHGITLFAHARSNEMKEYLASLGDADRKLPSLPIPAEERASVVGRYTSESGSFAIDVQNERLGISGAGIRSRVLLHRTAALTFYPSGSPWTKIDLTEPDRLSIRSGAGEIEARK